MSAQNTSNWLVYMVLCKDGSFYIGSTNNLPKRLATHTSGKGARYTRARLPISLVYTEKCIDHSESLKKEYALKQLTHQEKMKLTSM